ncbi:MAG: glycine betaine ABC transporter substrate-binding protein [Shinella sp.]|uniref:glycine betaine ABC transporter substrate-binding protein n=1 Tax=Shinella sp. TaxID=1870904 RepID=UPI003C767B6B
MTFVSKFTKTLLSAAAAALVATSAWGATITIGSKNFTEQLIIAEMTKQLLQSKGYTVNKKEGMGTSIVRAALENGEVSLYWEYTGTSLITFNKVTERLSPEETYERVRALDAEKGLVWLAPSRANNTYAYVIKPDNPKTQGFETISDLAKAYTDGVAVLMGTTAEFPRRADGLIGLQKAYDFEAGRANLRPMDIGLAYNALANGDIDTLTAQATDGQIAAMGLKVLKDDKEFFPSYVLTPVVRKDVLDANPELKDILEAVSIKLDDATMARMNGQVEVDKKTIEAVAADYLKSLGM